MPLMKKMFCKVFLTAFLVFALSLYIGRRAKDPYFESLPICSFRIKKVQIPFFKGGMQPFNFSEACIPMREDNVYNENGKE